jgi:hypothetical protein
MKDRLCTSYFNGWLFLCWFDITCHTQLRSQPDITHTATPLQISSTNRRRAINCCFDVFVSSRKPRKQAYAYCTVLCVHPTSYATIRQTIQKKKLPYVDKCGNNLKVDWKRVQPDPGHHGCGEEDRGREQEVYPSHQLCQLSILPIIAAL